MDRTQIEALLNEVRAGNTGVEQALERLRDLPFEDIGFAKVDHHRALRTGMPEVIFAAGKTPAQVGAIFARMSQHGGNVLATRASAEMFAAVRSLEAQDKEPRAYYHETARTKMCIRDSLSRPHYWPSTSCSASFMRAWCIR